MAENKSYQNQIICQEHNFVDTKKFHVQSERLQYLKTIVDYHDSLLRQIDREIFYVRDDIILVSNHNDIIDIYENKNGSLITNISKKTIV